MPCFCMSQAKWLRTDWFPVLTEGQIRALRHHGGKLPDIYAHIERFFDAHIINQINRVCVTLNCPEPWPAVLGPLWLASGQDVDRAAMFFGNLYCRVAIRRPEYWASASLPIFRQRADPSGRMRRVSRRGSAGLRGILCRRRRTSAFPPRSPTG